jgi:hypothetical protein
MEAASGKAAIFADKGRSPRTDGSAASQPSENEFSGFDYFDRIDRRDLRRVYTCFLLSNAPVYGCFQRAAAFDNRAGNGRSAVGGRYRWRALDFL